MSEYILSLTFWLASWFLEVEQSIYVVTQDSGVSAFSLETNQVTKISNISVTLTGIIYDSARSKLYWLSNNAIYRANMDGDAVETVLSTSEYGALQGLAFDWITTNVYIATLGGYIIACSGVRTLQTFNCSTILTGQSGATGIALDPTEGIMYWTRYDAGTVGRAGMDGSSPTTLTTGLRTPEALTVDYALRRLFWAEQISNKIQSSDLDGRNLRTVVELPSGSYPFGMALWNERIYFGGGGDFKLQRSSKAGQDIQTLYTETDFIRHIAIVPALDQPTVRMNHCEGRNCTKLCVLTPTSYHCLD